MKNVRMPNSYINVTGYVAGDLKFRCTALENGLDSSVLEWTNCLSSSNEGGIAISSIWSKAVHSNNIETQTSAQYLIVVEKEGVFRRLCEDKIYLYL
jgi:DNA topoisomerase VI subunit A